jgi:hypothetical protein
LGGPTGLRRGHGLVQEGGGPGERPGDCQFKLTLTKFQPATKDGVPVDVPVSIELEFRLHSSQSSNQRK